jgi:hypothetical protein
MVMVKKRELAEQAGGKHGDQHGEPGVAGVDGGAESSHCADQHHALDAQVHHARSLGEDLADGSEQQHGAGCNSGL